MNNALKLSIDLDAEIRKIGQKQHLNQAHFLVQLVRHAIKRGPVAIHIQAAAERVSLSHDGAPLPETEWDLLTTLLIPGASSESQQRAIETLELEHGIAALAALLRFPETSLSSGGRALIGRHGVFETQAGPPATRGFRFEARRPPSTLRRERAELAFYCAGAHTSIFYNGRPINKPIQLENQLLAVDINNEHGRGQVGVPLAGDLCALSFAKQGVRFGVKQFIPLDGMLYHGHWDSGLTGYEPNFDRSVSQGEAALRDQARWLYARLGDYFAQMDDGQKLRVKKILFGLQADDWAAQYGGLPLFHSVRAAFALSLRDLRALAAQFGAVPFAMAARRDAPAAIPRLLPEDLHFLRHEHRLSLRPLNQRRANPWRRLWTRLSRRRPAPAQALPAEALSGPERVLLQALNRDDQLCRFAFTEAGCGLSQDRSGRKRIWLSRRHPRVVLAMERCLADPAAAPLIKYQLMDLASAERRRP